MLRKSMRISKDGLTIKDIDMSKRTAVIAFATYGSLDRDGDRANKGMFAKSWQEGRSDIRFFKNHDKNSGPGKVEDFWEDDKHAYVKAYLGTHTEGNDMLIQLDEGIIVAASYGFLPVKERMTRIDNKGYDYKSVRWLEVSGLTHWGAHPESTVRNVSKSYNPEILKELNEGEKNFLRQLLANRQEALRLCMNMADTVAEGDDMWSYVNELLGEQSYNIAWLKRRLEYGVKELEDIQDSIKVMERFVSSGKASDECIQQVQTELDNTKQLLSEFDTADTSAQDHSTRTQSASNDDNEFLKQVYYSLLKSKAS